MNRLLVVDDESLIRWSLTQMFGDHGYEVVGAPDAASAIRAVLDSPTPFDVALLDFRLPDSDNLDLLSQLRTLTPMTRIVMMTAHGTPELRAHALTRGAFWLVEKPFELGEMAGIVSQAMAQRYT